mmetsp:Transcript_27724/g.83111  ORF Transcript_27724/g.83111 Transcript_27724/m.83111 type:complete len:481 (-) Transcript_27724:20-1462(-)
MNMLNRERWGARPLPSMQELIGKLDEKIAAGQRDQVRREAERQRAGASVMDGSQDVLDQLESLEEEESKSPKPRKRRARGQGAAGEHCVAIVLGKALCRGRLSIEHAARCSALARAIREGRLVPDRILFTSSAASKTMNNRDDATTACTYFLHLCDSLNITIDESIIRVASTPITTRDGMAAVLRSAILPELAPNARLHAAFFASDYQVGRIERIGAVTPRLSLFAPLAERRDAYLYAKRSSPQKKKRASAPPALGATTWSMEKVAYPPGLLVAGEGAFAAAFLAQTHVIFDSLVPLLHNMHAIVNREEFLAREYYDDLLIAKRRVAEQLHLVDSPMRPATLKLRTMSTTAPAELAAGAGLGDDDALVDEAVERILHSLSELERLVRPAATRQDFLDEAEWRAAYALLQKAISEARAATDPDRPLPASEWGRLVDQDEAVSLDLTDLLELQRLSVDEEAGSPLGASASLAYLPRKIKEPN